MRNSNKIRNSLIAAFLGLTFTLCAQEVSFSTPGGFYDKAFKLALACDQHDKVIHYTTNGNAPTADDPVYTAPLSMSPLLYSRSNIYKIRNCPPDAWYVPNNVQRCIVIRAAAFDAEGQRVGTVATNSYFISTLGCDTHDLPVMSLCVDSLDLFDYNTGIFVPGVHYDPSDPDFSGNYFQTGSEWEKPCNVEFYESDNRGINQQAGVRTQGLSTRRYSQKGLKIYAREEYGKKRFKYKFFSDTDINSFKHLKVKPFQGGWHGIGCQDYISGCIARRLNLDCLASRPMVLYLNGEYWGIYYLQEKPDERYLEDHYDIDLDDINIIESWNGTHCEYGSGQSMTDLHRWIASHDLEDDENYQYVTEQIDIHNFIDYEIFEIFSANQDWPANNMRCWQTEGGLWRWIFYDGDACVYRKMPDFNPFGNATYDGDRLYPSSKTATLLFRELMQNESFKHEFLNRFDQLLKSEFTYTNTKPIFDKAYSDIVEEIEPQIARFNNPESYKKWQKRINRVDDFLSGRTTEMYDKLRELYSANASDISLEAVYQAPSRNEIVAIIQNKKASLADIMLFDLSGRQLVHSTLAIAVGEERITLPANYSSGIYIVYIGGQAKKIMIVN